MATIEDNYNSDYSSYYLEFASSQEAQQSSSSGPSRNDLIVALREAALKMSKQLGISVIEARARLQNSASLRAKWMGASVAAQWEGRNEAPRTGTPGSTANLSGSTSSSSGGGGMGSAGYGALIADLGLADGLFQPMIDMAVRNGWTAEQFRAAVLQSPQFEQLFPGIKRADGSLRMSASEYRQLGDSYTAVAKEFGMSMSGARIGMLIGGAVSPQEFYQRSAVFEKVKANPGLKDAFNEQLGEFGMKPLNDQDWFKFLAGVGSKDYYDVYEAAQLRNSGLNIDAGTAAGAARNIGEAGTPSDIAALVTEARNMLADIGPELLRESITDADLVQMSAGYDPKGLEPKLRTIVANRRAQGTFVMGSRASSSGEQTTVFTPDEAAAY